MFKRRLLVGLTMVSAVAACRGPSPLRDLARAEALAADLRLQLEKTDKASAQAVMADTDDTSQAFAEQAMQAGANVTRNQAQLTSLLQSLRFAEELQSLTKFEASWEKYQAAQGRILSLAVENTNLKSQALSFGPVQEAADSFRDAVVDGAQSLSGKGMCRSAVLAQSAVVAVREAQLLLGPHIAESEDAKMTHIEQEIAERERRAREQLQALEALGASARWGSARAALDRFHALLAKAIQLSRRNTNVRSLALSLHEQIALAAACDDELSRLQKSLAGESSRATR